MCFLYRCYIGYYMKLGLYIGFAWVFIDFIQVLYSLYMFYTGSYMFYMFRYVVLCYTCVYTTFPMCLHFSYRSGIGLLQFFVGITRDTYIVYIYICLYLHIMFYRFYTCSIYVFVGFIHALLLYICDTLVVSSSTRFCTCLHRC